jgi:hypothetical protein
VDINMNMDINVNVNAKTNANANAKTKTDANVGAGASEEEFVCRCGHPLEEHTDLSDRSDPDSIEWWVCNARGCACTCFSPETPPLALNLKRKEASPTLEGWL